MAELTPAVRLGRMADNGIAASFYALLERGAGRRPDTARALRGTAELRFDEGFAPVRLTFSPGDILVEDADDADFEADLVVSGSLPHVVRLAAAPQIGGVPKLTDARGRAALSSLAGGKVKLEGSPLLGRRLLQLLEI